MRNDAYTGRDQARELVQKLIWAARNRLRDERAQIPLKKSLRLGWPVPRNGAYVEHEHECVTEMMETRPSEIAVVVITVSREQTANVEALVVST